MRLDKDFEIGQKEEKENFLFIFDNEDEKKEKDGEEEEEGDNFGLIFVFRRDEKDNEWKNMV